MCAAGAGTSMLVLLDFSKKVDKTPGTVVS